MAFLHDNIHTKTEFPHQTRTIDHIWIPLADGTRLAARIWLPIDAESNPVPALLEYLPYRKNDGTAWRDSIRHPYLAGHGYASVRVDMRGNGDSDGVMLDEYTAQELSDCLEVLQWLAAQPWCTGNIGMFGKSWGGFNALQVAALQPPELKAIITIASTDDRYADDVHYMGGCLLGSEMLSWATTMLCYNACPPDPRVVGDEWLPMYKERLEQTPPFAEAWVSHQRRDEFWQYGSVCEDYSAITCPVYAVGSWVDGYTNAVPRLLEGLSQHQIPCKGLLGPWAHNFPENSAPGPAIGFLQQSLRWWDHWLKGVDTGIMDEPMLTTWIQQSDAPATTKTMTEGYWVMDPSWPSPNVTAQTMPLTATQPQPQTLIGSQLTGLDSPAWLQLSVVGTGTVEQRAENSRSLCYTTTPQPTTALLGFPEVHLTLQVDQPQASIAVRLCDVAPDGTTALVTWGLLNLSHRDSHEHPAAMPINTSTDITVKLSICGYQLPADHRWQVAISPTYWPHIWPSPKPVALTIEQCALVLPIRNDEQILADSPFELPECAPPLPLEEIKPSKRERTVNLNRVTNTAELSHIDDSGTVRFPDGLLFSETSRDKFQITEGEPLSARVYCGRTRKFDRDDRWLVTVYASGEMWCDAENFYLDNMVSVHLDRDNREQIIFQRRWEKTIPRDFQ
ncbi:MAG: CocE/NonD family hydrolase [Chloroflexota bacterium]